jgi:hypothetical protein
MKWKIKLMFQTTNHIFFHRSINYFYGHFLFEISPFHHYLYLISPFHHFTIGKSPISMAIPPSRFLCHSQNGEMVKSPNHRRAVVKSPRFRIDGGGGGAFSQHLSNGFFRLATSKIRLVWMAIF